MTSPKIVMDRAFRLWEAVSGCPHVIEADEVRLKFDPRADGDNAANQLHRRIEKALAELAPEIPQTSRPVRGRGDLVRYIDDLLAKGAAPAGRVRDVSVREPQFDVCAPGQEELVLEFVNEISQTARERGMTPDPIRLLEMAEALYRAEAVEWEYQLSQEIDGAATGRQALRQLLAAHDGVPDGEVAKHEAVNQLPSIREVAKLVEILDGEVERLRALDREHARLEAWILLNTDYKPTDPALDPTDRLERALDRLLKRAEGAR